MPKLEERRFVVFEAAVVDVDQIIAMIDLPPNAKRPAPTIAILLEKGSPIMLDGISRSKAVQWWNENVVNKAEKIELKEPPPPIEPPPEPVPVSPVTAPVTTPAPAKTPVTTPVETSTPIETPVVAEPETPAPTLADMLNLPPTEAPPTETPST